jgi:hypothetical protein
MCENPMGGGLRTALPYLLWKSPSVIDSHDKVSDKVSDKDAIGYSETTYLPKAKPAFDSFSVIWRV